MTFDKYQEDKKRCDEISRLLREKSQGKSRDFLAEQLALKTDLKRSLCYSLIGDYFRGDLTYFVSDDFTHLNYQKPKNHEMHVRRLALFYEVLGVHSCDPIVDLTRQVSSYFTYPPQPLPEKPYSCNITVKFSHKDLSLKSEQHENLEQLALKYALENRDFQ